MIMLSFYISEKQRHNSMPLYEWLLEEAKAIGVHGGSVFRAIAGFGRHGRLHQETFFELAGELAVKVEFIVDDELAERLQQKIRSQGLQLFHVQQAVQTGGV